MIELEPPVTSRRRNLAPDRWVNYRLKPMLRKTDLARCSLHSDRLHDGRKSCRPEK
jgi:hypothetical protein